MSIVPFKLYKYHKTKTKSSWNRKGLNMDKFEEIYNKYIYATNCELCNMEFINSRQRHMDHCHNTGEFRNIVCSQCNRNKIDFSIAKNNKTDYKFISYRKKTKLYKFCISRNGKEVIKTQSLDLNKLIIFRDIWIKNNKYVLS